MSDPISSPLFQDEGTEAQRGGSFPIALLPTSSHPLQIPGSMDPSSCEVSPSFVAGPQSNLLAPLDSLIKKREEECQALPTWLCTYLNALVAGRVF